MNDTSLYPCSCEVPSTLTLSSAIGSMTCFGWWDTSECNTSRGFKDIFHSPAWLPCCSLGILLAPYKEARLASLTMRPCGEDKLSPLRPLRSTSSQLSHLLTTVTWRTPDETNRKTIQLSLVPKPKLLTHRIVSKWNGCLLNH